MPKPPRNSKKSRQQLSGLIFMVIVLIIAISLIGRIVYFLKWGIAIAFVLAVLYFGFRGKKYRRNK